MLRWHEDNADVIGQSVKLNADCMLHAALEEDREMLAILYSFGYRLGLLKDTISGKYAMKRIAHFVIFLFSRYGHGSPHQQGLPEAHQTLQGASQPSLQGGSVNSG